MRVLICGGTGFLGRHIVNALMQQGHDPLRDAEAALDRRQLQAQQQRDAADQRARANQSAMALAQRLQVEREARKAVAWSQYFQPSAACKLDSGLAQCANEHIAAKKRFEASYVDR